MLINCTAPADFSFEGSYWLLLSAISVLRTLWKLWNAVWYQNLTGEIEMYHRNVLNVSNHFHHSWHNCIIYVGVIGRDDSRHMFEIERRRQESDQCTMTLNPTCIKSIVVYNLIPCRGLVSWACLYQSNFMAINQSINRNNLSIVTITKRYG